MNPTMMLKAFCPRGAALLRLFYDNDDKAYQFWPDGVQEARH